MIALKSNPKYLAARRMMIEDGFPKALILTEEERKASRDSRVAVAATQVDPRVEAERLAREQRKKEATQKRVAKMLAKKSDPHATPVNTHGMRWDTTYCKWVPVRIILEDKMDFSQMNGPQLVAVWNEMVLTAIDFGIKVDVVRKFADAATGRKRCAALHAEIQQKKPVEEITMSKKAPAGGKRSRFADDAKITKLVAGNPKREGTLAFKLWEKYKSGVTVAAYKTAGGPQAMAYLRWDIAHKLVKVG